MNDCFKFINGPSSHHGIIWVDHVEGHPFTPGIGGYAKGQWKFYFVQRECSFSFEAVQGIVGWLGQAMIYAHAIEGVNEYDVDLTTIVNEDLVQVPSGDIAVYHQRICVGRATKINVPCVEGKRDMGPLFLDH
jgi:hypothetical protein